MIFVVQYIIKYIRDAGNVLNLRKNVLTLIVHVFIDFILQIKSMTIHSLTGSFRLRTVLKLHLSADNKHVLVSEWVGHS